MPLAMRLFKPENEELNAQLEKMISSKLKEQEAVATTAKTSKNDELQEMRTFIQ